MTEAEQDRLTPRQRAVLERALELLVAGGERALTTAGVARAASCSKESLYKWFGDRDGLMAAMIAYQASKVRGFADNGAPMDRERFRAHLVGFAQDLLEVLGGDVSLALNRLAIGQASREKSRLGQLLVAQGRRRIDQSARALLDAGRKRGFIHYSDADEAYRTLYGLIVRDLHVRMLLGEEGARRPEKFAALAEQAVEQFFALYGARQKERAETA
ncbi:TetR/AcrR family transcriptional regulator [Chelativorans xinjiangense]|uniref:TetR/AcrR family transcriptional regulator n=1 Tax=Chelativorans xinjiangense TaxID=2681485 RepID=UPI001358C090|nr:TetR/AcrR family transcriptional regulator [Chelativorans xinjiangense]